MVVCYFAMENVRQSELTTVCFNGCDLHIHLCEMTIKEIILYEMTVKEMMVVVGQKCSCTA